MPPFGHTTQLRIFIDPDLLQYDEVWAAAGTWNEVFPIAPNDLARASGSVVTDPSRGQAVSGAPVVRLWKNDGVSVRSLVESFYDRLWNRVDLAIASEILDPEVSFRGSVGLAAVGRSAVCDYVTMVTTALSDYRCDVEELIAEGRNAAAKVRFSGLHREDFLGYPPTGRRVEWMGAAFFVEENGMLRNIWVLGDVTNLQAQLSGDV